MNDLLLRPLAQLLLGPMTFNIYHPDFEDWKKEGLIEIVEAVSAMHSVVRLSDKGRQSLIERIDHADKADERLRGSV